MGEQSLGAAAISLEAIEVGMNRPSEVCKFALLAVQAHLEAFSCRGKQEGVLVCTPK